MVSNDIGPLARGGSLTCVSPLVASVATSESDALLTLSAFLHFSHTRTHSRCICVMLALLCTGPRTHTWGGGGGGGHSLSRHNTQVLIFVAPLEDE